MDISKNINLNVSEYELNLIQYFIKEMPQEDDALFEEFETYIDARCMMMEADIRKKQIASDLKKLTDCLSKFGKQS
tara:strand:- start:383 stop:610 length:228 start_codon:yes stop_codon:yes gene_type:complete